VFNRVESFNWDVGQAHNVVDVIGQTLDRLQFHWVNFTGDSQSNIISLNVNFGDQSQLVGTVTIHESAGGQPGYKVVAPSFNAGWVFTLRSDSSEKVLSQGSGFFTLSSTMDGPSKDFAVISESNAFEKPLQTLAGPTANTNGVGSDDVSKTGVMTIGNFGLNGRTNSTESASFVMSDAKLFVPSGIAWELNSAREIQRNGLPAPLDLGSGLTIAGANLPAKQLSGDVYDYVRVGDKVYFLLCDVCGKGLGSAMIATHLARAFRVGARHGWSLAEIDREMHEAASEANGAEKFATGILGVLNVQSQNLELLAAGHESPSFFGNGYGDSITNSSALIHSWGSLLEPRIAPPVVSLQFHSGDSMVLYTDGVSDQSKAATSGSERFGRDRVLAAHRENADTSASALCNQVLGQAINFGQSADHPDDDMTILALHWQEKS
jgi:hypothetical protein